MNQNFDLEEKAGAEEIKLTHSGILAKAGKPMVSVRFERGRDFAEGAVPECRIAQQCGFSVEEIASLEEYLRDHAKEILRMAKDISGIKHWF